MALGVSVMNCVRDIEAGESPLDAAKRELLEETGYVSEEWFEFGSYIPNSSGCNNCCYTFIAINIKKVAEQALDITEEIKLHFLKIEEIKKMMIDGRIAEAVMLAPLWRYFEEKKF